MKDKILQIISNLFHPLLSMAWATTILILFTPLAFLPADLRLFIVGEAAFYSLVLPALIIILLSKFGVVKHGIALRNRQDRLIPLGIQVVTYTILAFLLSYQGLPEWALQFYRGAALLALLFFIVTFWWKISAHAAGNASIAVVSLILHYKFTLIFPLWIPVAMIVITGLVSSIRVYLGRHTLGQVACGALAGTVCMLISGLF